MNGRWTVTDQVFHTGLQDHTQSFLTRHLEGGAGVVFYVRELERGQEAYFRKSLSFSLVLQNN